MEGLVTATPLAFTIPSGASVEVSPVDATRTDVGVTLTVEADPATWETIDLVMLFNLRWDVRDEGAISGDVPVQIVLRPDGDLVDQLPVGDVVEALASLDADHPLRSNTNWYALEVTEAVELPPSLADTGDLRSGFTTRWAVEDG